MRRPLYVLAAVGALSALSQQPTSLALVGVNVITMEREEVLRDQTVVITNGRIASLGDRASVQVPSGARRVEAMGKYLIPGLWDMHVHPDDPEIYPINPPDADKEKLLPLFVLQGVTGVRDMGGDLRLLTSWRRRIMLGAMLGPRIFTGGPLVDGPRPVWPGSVPVTDSASAIHAIDSLVSGGADFIKVYSLVPRAAYFAIAAETKRRGIAFAGHVPTSVTMAEASDAGQRSEEHLPRPLANTDSAQNAPLYQRLARNGTWVTPTLINWYTNAFGEPDSLTRQRLPNLPEYLRRWWDPNVNVHLRGRSPASVAASQQRFAGAFAVVRQMHRAGVRLLAGSDQGGNPFCYPGWSLHDELALFVRAGLSPYQALETATRNPAEYFGIRDSLGTIARGKVADLVLLDANPLVEIRNTTRIAAVVVRGRLIDESERRRLLRR